MVAEALYERVLEGTAGHETAAKPQERQLTLWSDEEPRA